MTKKRKSWLLVPALTLASLAGAAGAAAAAPPALSAAERAFQAQNPQTEFYRTGGQITSVYGRAFSHGASAAQSAENFLAQNAALFGVTPDDLTPGSLAADGAHSRQIMPDAQGNAKFTLLSYLQVRDGFAVFRGDVRLLVRNEAGSPLVLARSAVRPVGDFRVDQGVAAEPNIAGAFESAQARFPGLNNFSTPELVVWAGTETAAAAPTLAVKFIGSIGDPFTPGYAKQLVLADAKTGAVLWTEDQINHVDISGSVKAMVTPGKKADICDTEVLTPLPYARVNVGATVAFTDINGNYTLPNAGSTAVNVTSAIRGRWFRVFTPSADAPVITKSVTPPGPGDFVHNQPNTVERDRASVNAYYNANVVRDFLLKYSPGFPTISSQAEFRVNVMVGGTCNAFYDGGSINFYPAGGGCPDTSFGDVVHHEYGHHIVSTAGSDQDQYGEGYGDLMGVLISDEPVLGYGFLGDCASGIRTAANNLQYPCSSGDPHECGQLLSGCFWDTRNALVNAGVSDYRDQLAKWATNSVLVHTGGLVTPQITIDVLTLDDDDANILNGTPHYDQIQTGFSKHHMDGPDIIYMTFDYPAGRPDTIAPSGGTAFDVTITPGSGFTLSPGSPALLVDPENDGSFASIPLTSLGGTLYKATMPPTPCGNTVKYYISARTTNDKTATSPKGAPGSVFVTLSASSVATAFSDSFQTDKGWKDVTVGVATSKWVRAVPIAGSTGAPPADFDGSGFCFVAGNNLNQDLDGSRTLESPVINVPTTDPNIAVSYARWFFTSDTGGGDKLVVRASNDGGANYVTLETVNAADGTGGWVKRSFRIADFLAPSATMKFQFVCTDASPDSTVEPGVDAFAIQTVSCGCAADFNGDGFLTGDDFDAYVSAFLSGNITADFNQDGFVTGDDFDSYVNAFNAGC